MPDLPPQLQHALADRYRIERELGHGGMALVFLADDLKHGRKVALKVLRPELAQSLGVERFLREIRISAPLNHPNILTLIDSGEAAGFMYYVLPYVAGESLRQRLDREKQLPVDEALAIAREIADALSYAHSLGVVHRDIKPENILFEAGHAVVTDFGIARAVSEAGGERLTESGLAVGTPAYMSPEQATGTGDVDTRSDIYSLACLLYEMLAGEPPYSGTSAQAILARKTFDPVPGLRVVRETVPPVVEAAIMRALAKVPADRFATARQFAEALTRATPPARAPAILRLARSPTAAAAAAIVVIAAAAYVALAIRGSETAAAPIAESARLTRDPGIEWFPSLSPDGQWLLYSGTASGKRDIYLLSVGGENPINLTKGSPADDDEPVFSPNGEQIAFRSERDGGGIFVMGRTGEAVRRVTRFGYRPTWNPDGTELAFATEDVDIHPQNIETHSQLWVVDVATGETRQIQVPDAVMPSWSPHGGRIAFFMRYGKAEHIWTVPAEGGAARQATPGDATDWSPTWSPDGRYLYFASDRGGSMNLWRVRINENTGATHGPPQPVTTPATFLAHPTISRDGRHIAYTSIVGETNVQGLAFDPVRGTVVGEPRWVTTGSRRWSNPDPAPDGTHVAFSSLTEPQGHLYVVRADGTALRQLTGDSATDRMPRWSPDGRWISFFSTRSGLIQIWKIHPDGSGLTQLTDPAEPVAYSVWSPDGKRMAAASTVTGTGSGSLLYIFDPDRPWSEQAASRSLTTPAAMAGFGPQSWSPDGARLAGQLNAQDTGVILYTIRTNTFERLTDYGEWPAWLPDSRRLLFVSGGKALYVIDRVTRQVKKVFSVSGDVIGPPALTPDGRMIYYSRNLTQADIWLATLR